MSSLPYCGPSSAYGSAVNLPVMDEIIPSDNAPDAVEAHSSSSDSGYDVQKTCCDSQDAAPLGIFLTLDERRMRIEEERELRVAKRREHLNPFARVFSYVVPYGGIISSGFNLASSSIGAGIISLPSGFNISGIGLATIYLVVVGLLTVYSFNLLAIVGHRTGLRNYEQITKVLLGPGAAYLVALLISIMCLGGDISYVIAVLGIIKAFMVNSPHVPDYLKTISGLRLITSMIWLVCMLPLCLPKEINSLRYFSVFGILFIIYFVICMIVHCGMTIHDRGGVPDDLVYFRSGNSSIEGLGIFMFAFICQVNCFEVYEEMYKPGIKRLTGSASLAVFLCIAVYFVSGIFGYLDFGSQVTDSVLLYYNPIEKVWLAIAYVGIICKVCVGFGLHMIPIRDAVYHVAKVDVKEIAWWKNAVLCTFFATVALVAGLFIPKINTVFGLVGSFCGGFIGFVLPALMFMYSGNWSLKSVGIFHYCMTYLLLIVGVIAVVFGTCASIYGVIV